MVANITDDQFQQEVVESPTPVLIDFWAEWCGPCKMLAPIVEEIDKELEGRVKIFKMDIDSNPNTPSMLGIRSIPTMMIFIDGKQVASKVGVLPKNSIIDWINSVIKT